MKNPSEGTRGQAAVVCCVCVMCEELSVCVNDGTSPSSRSGGVIGGPQTWGGVGMDAMNQPRKRRRAQPLPLSAIPSSAGSRPARAICPWEPSLLCHPPLPRGRKERAGAGAAAPSIGSSITKSHWTSLEWSKMRISRYVEKHGYLTAEALAKLEGPTCLAEPLRNSEIRIFCAASCAATEQ